MQFAPFRTGRIHVGMKQPCPVARAGVMNLIKHRISFPCSIMPPSHSIIDVSVAIIIRSDGAFLLSRRPAGKPYAGYWEFPGGKVQPGETFLHALQRELWEELGIWVDDAFPWITRVFTYPHAKVRLHFYRVVTWHGEPQAREQQDLSWQFPNDMQVEPMLPANEPILRALDLPTIYAITNAAEWGIEHSLSRMKRALDQGVRLVQIREKEMAIETLRPFAREIIALAHRHRARVLVSCSPGRINLGFWREVGADGVHFPAAHLMMLSKRPDTGLCGASCHNAEELFQAEQLKMDFAVLAPVMPTLSHPESPSLGWQKLASLIQDCSIPVFALGGLRYEDLNTAWEHGSHGVAMMRGSFEMM